MKKFNDMTKQERFDWAEKFFEIVKKNFPAEQDVEYIINNFGTPWHDSAGDMEYDSPENWYKRQESAMLSELEEEYCWE